MNRRTAFTIGRCPDRPRMSMQLEVRPLNHVKRHFASRIAQYAMAQKPWTTA